jgi:hypothetical protein
MKYLKYLKYLIILIIIIALIRSCGNCGGSQQLYNPEVSQYKDYKDACEALDFEAAYKLINVRDVYPEDYWYNQAKYDYVFNAEVTYLCGLKTKEANDRIVHILLELPSKGITVGENSTYSSEAYRDIKDYICYIQMINEKCDLILEKAIIEGNKPLALKILRLYKDNIIIIRVKEDIGVRDDNVYDNSIIETGRFTNAPKLAAQKKFEQAVADGAFDENEDED